MPDQVKPPGVPPQNEAVETAKTPAAASHVESASPTPIVAASLVGHPPTAGATEASTATGTAAASATPAPAAIASGTATPPIATPPGTVSSLVVAPAPSVAGASGSAGTAAASTTPAAAGTTQAATSTTPAGGTTPPGGSTAVNITDGGARPIWTVSGTILGADGTPQPNLRARVIRKRLRHEEPQPLGESDVQLHGAYLVRYPRPNDSASVDFVVRVIGVVGAPVAESPIVFDAGPSETVNLSLSGETFKPPSDWTALVTRLQPELDGVALGDLEQSKTTQDISFLARSIAHDPTDLAELAIACKLTTKTDVTPEVFYALFRRNIPSSINAALDPIDNVVIDDSFLTQLLSSILDLQSARVEAAVRAAVSDNVVPATLIAMLPDQLNTLQALRIQHVGATRYVRGKTPLTALLATSSAPQDLQNKFVAAYTQADGNLKAVWTQLGADPTVTQPMVATLRFTLNIGELVAGHLPLVQHFTAARAAAQIKGVRDVAKLDASDWVALLGQVDPAAASIPPVTATETAQAKIERFSATLATRFERAMPTPALAGRLTKDATAPVGSHADVVTFLSNSPKFDLARTHIDRFVQDNASAAFAGVGSQTQVVSDLKRMQRVFKLGPTYAVVKSLLTDKIDSAQAIYFMGKQTFVSRYGADAVLGQSQAVEIYQRSETVYANALALYATHNAAFNFGSPAAVSPEAAVGPNTASTAGGQNGASAAGGQNPPQAASNQNTPQPSGVQSPPQAGSQNTPQAAFAAFPNLQSLFGSVDYCACEDCRSVLSPAAYLVDLLQFLGARAANTANTSAKQVLLQRRPDIADIELSCDNTNIALPYIDLVCETLEDAIVPSATPPRQRQTSGSADDLRATPAFVNAPTYDVLRSQTTVFPLSMPFDLWVEQSRAFLRALGQSRADIMQLYQAAAGSGTPDDVAIAAETLNINAAERTILNGPGVVPGWTFWGLLETANDVINPKSPDDPKSDYTGGWLDVLARVPVFLQRTELDFRGLLQLLDARFVNPGATPVVQLGDAPDAQGFVSCDTASMTLAGLTNDWLDRAHRFLRLWRKTGLTMWDLDKAVLSPGVGNSQIGDATLAALAAVTALQARLGLALDELLGFWSDLDATPAYTSHLGDSDVSIPSVYERNFRNPALASLGAVFPTDATKMAGLLSDSGNVTAIGAALNLPSDDIAAIAAAAALPNVLNLHNLSVLFRYARLSSALSITVSDLLLWIGLSGVDPFATPALAQSFLLRYDVLSGGGLIAPDLDYLLRHGSANLSGLVLPDDAIALNLSTLRTGLQKIADKTALAGSSDKDRVQSLVSGIPEFKDPSRVSTLVQIIEGTFAGGQPVQDAFILQHVSAFTNAASAQARLDQPVANATDVTARYAFALAALTQYLATSFVTQSVADQLSFAAQTAAVLLSQGTLVGSTQPLATVLADPRLLQLSATGDAYALDPTRANFPDAYAAYTLLAKTVRVLIIANATPQETAWLMQNARALGWLTPTGLPTASGSPATYQAFAWLLLGVGLQHSLRAGTVRFFEHIDAVTATTATLTTAIASASALLGWDASEVTSLVNAFGITDPKKLADVGIVDRLRRAVAMAKNLGIGATLALNLATGSPTSDDAAATRQILKSKYDAITWRKVLTPIEDALREKKRDALVSYLLAHASAVQRWQTADDLYGWFLFDTQMEACLLSTRILLGTGAVQLFIQRCFLQLEPQVTVNADITVTPQPNDPPVDEDWLQWKWMQQFRVWQANREVFLWPENYLVPTLRPDQSPFFADFSKELLQCDLTSDTAEDAFRHYLEKLADVQRLVVCAHYHETDGPHDTIHVVARTSSTSPTYFYRKRVDKLYWTPWEKIDLDISGEHLLLVMWDRRLHLVWPMFSRQAQPAGDDQLTIPTTPGGGQAIPPRYYWDIQLAISEKKSDKWTPKRILEQKLVDSTYSPKASQCFKAYVASSDELIVDVYQEGWHWGEFIINAATGNVFASVLTPLPLPDPPLSLASTYGAGADAIGQLDPANYHGLILLPDGLIFEDERFADDPTKSSPKPLDVQANVWPPRSVAILGKITRPALAVAQQDIQFDSLTPFFIEDPQRSFFVDTAFFLPGSHGATTTPDLRYGDTWVTQFAISGFYHPYVSTMVRELNRGGVPALLARNLQVNPDTVRGTGQFDFNATYQPQAPYVVQYPGENIDFTVGGAYASYNWELFFHAPFLIASNLFTGQSFEDALKWLQYIFDPTDGSNGQTPQRYWRMGAFFNTTSNDYQQQQIENLLQLVSAGDPQFTASVEQWRADPFDPFGIAKYRTVAFQRAVVMKYIDTLIAWGDLLFRADTMETTAQATQLYVLASQLLGPRPEVVRLPKPSDSKTYNELLALGIDGFSNAVVDVENLLPVLSATPLQGPTPPKLPLLHTFYFCVPPNQQLLGYWDLVADRLFKIRHCMDIEGNVRQLPLYAPPINPMLLVRAAAAGVDLSSILADENAPLPNYRFSAMFAKAIEMCNEVRALAGPFLAALEKRDAEQLAALHAGQEVALLTKLRDAKVDQHEAAKADRLTLDKTMQIAQTRLTHYSNLISAGKNTGETAALAIQGVVATLETVAAGVFTVAAAVSLVPDFVAGAAGFGATPTLHVKSGGSAVRNAGHMSAEALRQGISALNTGSQLASTLAGYSRREEDWQLQQALAEGEVDQVTQQQVASEIRMAISQAELDAHDLQTSNAQAVNDFLTLKKFTNVALYDWMSTKLSTLYMQAYNAAYDLAKRAEQAFNYELGLEQSFIQFGYWNNLYKGLVAADLLMFDLRRMEASYCDLNKREYEITRSVSLALLDPTALLRLRETGITTFELPEAFFDDDYPGHYFRRLKSVSLTIPCVVGPYTNVNATLTLASSSIRKSADVTGGYKRKLPPSADPRFNDLVGAVQAIATSSAQNDAGLFEVSFQDERYLPFERQGAISSWQLEVPLETNRIDVSKLTDAIVHVHYTARDGGQSLRDQVLTEVVRPTPRNGAVLVSMKQQFSDAFFRFMQPTGAGQSLPFAMTPNMFSLVAPGKTIKIARVDLFMTLRDPQAVSTYAGGAALKVSVGPDTAQPGTAVTLASDPTFGNVPHGFLSGSFAIPATWHIAVDETDVKATGLDQTVQDSSGTTHDRINPALVDDLLLVIQFQAT